MKQCRICLEENEDIDDLISPCKCDGTQKYVHSKCLEKWRDENLDKENYKRCQECLSDYRIEIIGSNSKRFFICKNITRCYYYIVSKQVLFFTLINYSVFLGLGKLIKLCLGPTNYIIQHIDDAYFNYELLSIPIIGGLFYSIVVFLFYHIISYILVCKKKNVNWTNSSGMSIQKINNINFVILILFLIFPVVGFFINFAVMKLTTIFFLEYFFSSYLKDKTRVVDLQDNEPNELNELLIV